MSIGSPPDRGYREFQRIVNWDSGILYGHGPGATGAQEQSGILDVGRYAYLVALDTVNAPGAVVQVSWWADQAATILVGTRTFQLVASIGGAGQYRLLNLGPFATISWFPVTGASVNHAVQVFGSNRVHPLEFIPPHPVLVQAANINLAANATDVLYPSDYYAGPVAAMVEINQAAHLELQWLDQGNNWQRIGRWTLTAGTWTTIILIAPSGAWRVALTNDTANASTYQIALTPSMTGAA